MASNKTPISGADPYCSGEDFLVRYDVRTVADALSDENVPIDVLDVADNTKLLAILRECSGKLEAAVMLGGKYTPDDLAALTGNSAQWLKSIVADLAAPRVLGRRFVEFPDFAERLKEAEGVLVALSEGKLIFGLQENVDAGVLNSEVETPQQVEARQMITWQSRAFFGRRANRNITPNPPPRDPFP